MKTRSKHIFYLFILLAAFQKPFAQNAKIDSLRLLLKTSKNDTNKAIILNSLADKLCNIGEYDEAMLLCNEGKLLSEGFKFNKGLMSAYNILGLIFYYQGNFPKSLENHFKSLRIAESINEKTYMATSFNNLAIVYCSLNKYDEALSNFKSALKIREELADKNSAMTIQNNIGNVFLLKGDYAQALATYNIALNTQLEIFKSQKTDLVKRNIANSYTNIGNAFNHLGNYTEAIKNHFEALKIQEEIHDMLGMEITYINLGAACTDSKKFKEAEVYSLKALEIAKNIEDLEGMRDSYENLAAVFEATNDTKKSLQYYKSFIQIRDSMSNEESTKKIVEQQMQYEFDKKEAVTKVEHDKQVLTLENENKINRLQKIFLIATVVLALVLLFFAKRAYDNRKKYSEILSKENEQKELLLQEVHHRVNNSLQMISSLLAFQADNTDSEEVREYLSKSEQRIQAMSVMHELLHESNTQLVVDIDTYIFKVLDFYTKLLENSSKITMEIHLPHVQFHSKMALPIGLIVNELITNAVKYAFPDDRVGIIKISLTETDKNTKTWLLSIKDNGIGLPPNYKEKQNSLGIRLVTIMAKQLGGTLQASSSNGSSFEIEFKNQFPS